MTNQIYKYNRFPNLILGTILFTCLPVSSLFEVITTGAIDLNDISSGRFQIYTWKLYLIGWICLIVIFPIGLFASWKYALRSYVFKISQRSIVLDGHTIERADVIGTQSTVRGEKVMTQKGAFFVHPNMAAEGQAAFEQFMKTE